MAQLSAPGKCDDFHVVAAVFADGSVSGDFTWINAIVSERRMVYQDIAKAAEILNKAVADGTALSDVAKQLEEWQNRELPIVQRGKPSANYGLTNGARSQPMTTGQPAPDPTPPTRPFPHAAVPGATLWLLEDQKTSLTEAIAILSGWQKRLGLMKPVAEAGETPAPLTRLLNGPLPLTQPAPDLRGKPAPDFTLKDVDGTPLALKDLRGKTVFVDFWATWCKPCIAEMPQIKALYDEFKDRGLVVIAIDLREPAGKARKYFEENGYPFRNLLDPGRVAFQAYGGGGIPKVALIDKDGIVRFFQQGYNSRQDFRAEVMKLGLK